MAQDVDTIISRQAISDILVADKNINTLDKSIKELIDTLIVSNTELKKEGISFKEVATQQKAASDNAKILTDEQKKLATIEKSVATNTDRVVEARVRATQKSKEQKDRITELVNAENKEIGTMQKLKNANKKLAKERDNLNLKTKEGTKRLKEINTSLDKNNTEIKGNTDALGKQKIGIGGYTDGIKNALSQMGPFGAVINQVTTNFTSFNKTINNTTASTKAQTAAQGALNTAQLQGAKAAKILKIALAATGIGLLLIGFAALVQFFRRTEEGASKLQQILAPMGVTLGNLGDLAGDLGEAIIGMFENPKDAALAFVNFLKDQVLVRINSMIKLFGLAGKIMSNVFSGEFAEAADNLKEAGKAYADVLTGIEDTTGKIVAIGKGIADGTRENIREGKVAVQLEKDKLKLQKATRKNLVDEAEKLAEIADLILLTRQADGDRVEQQAALIEAEKIQKDISATRLGLQEEALRIKKEEAALSDSDADTLDEIAQMEAELFKNRREEADKVREIINRQVELQNKINAELKTEELARKKIDDEAIKALEKEKELKDKAAEEAIKAQERFEAIIDSINDDAIKKLTKRLEKEKELKDEADDKELDKIKEFEETKAELKERLVDESIAAGFSIFQSNLNRQSMALEEDRARELEAAEGDKAAQAKINEKFDKQQAAIKTKQAKAAKIQALIEIGINTARAIISTLAITPLPIGLPLLLLTAAIGAVQLAAVAAKPIPKFFKGTESAPSGFISLAERGGELIRTKTGEMLYASQPTITSGLGGAKIYTNDQTKRIMSNSNIGFDSRDLQEMVNSNKRIERAIKNQPHYHFKREKIIKRMGNYSEIYHNQKIKGV